MHLLDKSNLSTYTSLSNLIITIYRKEPFNLKSVPTLVRWKHNTIMDIIDSDLETSTTKKEAYALVEKFMYKNND